MISHNNIYLVYISKKEAGCPNVWDTGLQIKSIRFELGHSDFFKEGRSETLRTRFFLGKILITLAIHLSSPRGKLLEQPDKLLLGRLK